MSGMVWATLGIRLEFVTNVHLLADHNGQFCKAAVSITLSLPVE